MSDEEMVDEGDPRDRAPRDNLVRSMPSTEVRSVEGQTDGRIATLFGRMANYNEWAEVRSQVEGHFLERVAPGAFTKTFAENRSRMRVIYDHGQDRDIGRMPLGPLEDVLDSERGIDYQAPLLDAPYNHKLLPALRAGLMGSSYRFDTIKDTWKQHPGRSAHNPDGLPERTVIEAKVIELGPTPFPVYGGTSAGVRSLTDEFLAGLVLPAVAPALPSQAEAGPHSEASRAATYPPISLDDFVRTLSDGNP